MDSAETARQTAHTGQVIILQVCLSPFSFLSFAGLPERVLLAVGQGREISVGRRRLLLAFLILLTKH
jgi:hypothetical protein